LLLFVDGGQVADGEGEQNSGEECVGFDENMRTVIVERYIAIAYALHTQTNKRKVYILRILPMYILRCQVVLLSHTVAV